MQHGRHDRDVELVVHAEVCVLEELLPEGVLLRLRLRGVRAECGGERGGGDAHVFGEVVPVGVVLHEPAPAVVLAVPFDLLRRGAVEDEADGVLTIIH